MKTEQEVLLDIERANYIVKSNSELYPEDAFLITRQSIFEGGSSIIDDMFKDKYPKEKIHELKNLIDVFSYFVTMADHCAAGKPIPMNDLRLKLIELFKKLDESVAYSLKVAPRHPRNFQGPKLSRKKFIKGILEPVLNKLNQIESEDNLIENISKEYNEFFIDTEGFMTYLLVVPILVVQLIIGEDDFDIFEEHLEILRLALNPVRDTLVLGQ